MNIFAAVISFLTGSAVGFYFSYKLKRRVKALSQCILLISEFETKIRYSNHSIGELLKSAAQKEEYSELIFLAKIDCTDNFHNSWNESVNVFQTLKADDREILKSLGSALGMTDRDGQISNLEEHKNLLKTQLCAAEDEYRQKGRMSRSIGALGGLAAGIVIV